MTSPRSRTDQLRARLGGLWQDVTRTFALDMIGLASLLVIFPITTRSLGPGPYGQYAVLYLIFGLAGLWIHSGAAAALVQLHLQMERDVSHLLGLARRQIGIAVLGGGSIGAALAVALLGRDILVPALLVMFVDLSLTSWSNLNVASIYAVEGVARSSTIRIFVPVLRAVAIVGLALGDAVTITTLVSVNVAVSAALVARTEVVVRRRAPTGTSASATQSEVARYSGYYSTSMSTNALQNEGEKFVLASARPVAEVGQYAATYRVVATSLLPLSAVISAANRRFMIRDDRPGAQRLRTLRLSVPVAVYGAVAGVAILIGHDLVERLTGSEFDDAGLMAIWLCALPLLHGLAELPPMGLLGLGRNRERMLMGLATSSVAVLAYVALVPPLGWRGAVLGTYVSELVSIALGWLLLVRYQRRTDVGRTDSSPDTAADTDATTP